MNKAVLTLLVASIVVPSALSQSTSSTTKQVSGSKSTSTNRSRTTAKQQSAPAKPAGSPSTPVEPEKAPQPAETKPDTTSKADATQKAPDKTETTPSDETKAATTDEKIAEPETPADPITELRAKIEAATDVEKLRLQLKLADQLATAGRQPEAMTELIHAAATDIFDPTSFYNIGNSFARLGATDAAINAYRKAIDQRKGNYSRAYNNMGVILLRSGRWDEAQHAFLAALKIESFRYAEASYNLGRLYAAQGQNDLATREWRRALSVDPRHSAAAEALTRNSSGETIVVEPKTTSDPKPKSTSSLKPQPANNASASARPTKNLTIDQLSFDYLQRARNSSERGKNTDAIDNYRRLIGRQGGYFAPANLEMSYALITLKRYDEALANLLQVATRDGGRYPISHYHLARVYEIKGDLKQAEQEFAAASTAYGSENSQFLLDLSRVREKQGNYKGALEAMEQYVSQVEAHGLKYDWSDERLSTLRQKVAAVPK
jgi:tetratricopeptide (TPR) repeat protein